MKLRACPWWSAPSLVLTALVLVSLGRLAYGWGIVRSPFATTARPGDTFVAWIGLQNKAPDDSDDLIFTAKIGTWNLPARFRDYESELEGDWLVREFLVPYGTQLDLAVEITVPEDADERRLHADFEFGTRKVNPDPVPPGGGIGIILKIGTGLNADIVHEWESSFGEGITLFSLPCVPAMTLTAAELMDSIAAAGGTPSCVSTKAGGRLLTRSHTGHGPDFELTAGVGYIVTCLEGATVMFTGDPLDADGIAVPSERHGFGGLALTPGRYSDRSGYAAPLVWRPDPLPLTVAAPWIDGDTVQHVTAWSAGRWRTYAPDVASSEFDVVGSEGVFVIER